MRAATTPPHLHTLILLTAFSPLTLNMFLPSLANIADDLQTDYAVVSLAVAGYLAVTAVIQLIAGPLSDRFGRRPVLLIALSVFTLASMGCALAEDIWTFLAFRMLQGGMIAGYTISLAIVRDTTEERKAAGLISYVSMSMAVAPLLGPMLGGLLDTAFGWRASFYFYFMSGVTLLVLCWIDLGETNDAARSGPDQKGDDVKALLVEARFWGYALCTAFSIGAFYTFLAGAPLVARAVFDVSTATLGVLIGSITAGFMTGSFLSARLAPSFPLTTMMLAGRLVACSGLLIGLLILLAGHLSLVTFFGATVFVGLGNGLTIPSSNAGAMSIRPQLAGTAAGVSGALTVAGGAALTTLTGFLLTDMNAPYMLIGIMFVASFAGLLSAAWVRHADRAIA
ncbi:MAG: Bcr/CflA family efflux MFS transporter [Geminicoccaceae bacterium]